MPIDEVVSTSILALRLIERALHDRSGWVLACGREIADATIEVGERHVTMHASFTHTSPDEQSVSIYHHGEIVWTRPVLHDGGHWDVAWTWHIESALVDSA